MAYQPPSAQVFSPSPSQAASGYYSSPPPPPPKPQGSSTPMRGPPLPPPPSSQIQNEPSELDGSAVHPQYQQRHQQAQQGRPEPNIPAVEPGWLPESLRDKTTTDLHALLESPDLLSALLANPDTTHPSVAASENSLKPLLEANITLATTLQQLETQLSHQRAQSQSRLLALRALEQQHRSKITETEEALKQFSPMALYQRLNGSVQEQEQLVRGLEESWLDESGIASERELGDFMRRVREARKVEFLRKERKERWDEGRVGGWR